MLLLSVVSMALLLQVQAQKKTNKQVVRYDTIIRKHVTRPVVKAVPVAKVELVLPTPEFINQPYYYDKNDNRLIKLENATAQLLTKRKRLG